MAFLSSLLPCCSSNNVQRNFSDSDDDKPAQENGVSKEGTNGADAVKEKKPVASTSAKVASKAETKPKKIEPYSAAASISLFQQYADADEPDVIGAEGIEKLCTDAALPLEGSLPVILAWQLGASETLRFTKEEWMKGTGALKVSNTQTLLIACQDLENLLIFQKPPVKAPAAKTPDPYDRTRYREYAVDYREAYKKLYTFAFQYFKPSESKNMEMDTATALWSIVLQPRYPLAAEIISFIAEKNINTPVYRAATKDLWNMVLEFVSTVEPDLSNLESDGSWPVLIDDFVEWKQARDSEAA